MLGVWWFSVKTAQAQLRSGRPCRKWDLSTGSTSSGSYAKSLFVWLLHEGHREQALEPISEHDLLYVFIGECSYRQADKWEEEVHDEEEAEAEEMETQRRPGACTQ